MQNKWRVPAHDREVIDAISNSAGISSVLAAILCSRKIISPFEAENFLKPRLSSLHSPFLMSGMDAAVKRIRAAIDRKERVGIFADSDLDGITSLASLNDFFSRCGITPFYRYYKDDETYGITPDMISDFIREEVTLLLTVDSGIRDIEAVDFAVKNGIDVIVTDHHEEDTVLPDAIIVNPKLSTHNYPFPQLAGVGVVFKLIHAVLMSYHKHFGTEVVIAAEHGGEYGCARMNRGIITGRDEFKNLQDIFNAGNTPSGSRIIAAEAYLLGRMNIPEGYIPFPVEIISGVNKNPAAENRAAEFSCVSGRIDALESACKEAQFASSKKTLAVLGDILPFTAIGTIADIMPLIDENRVLVYHGLEKLKTTRHLGLAALMADKPFVSKTISWEIAPLLNTPGRFGRTSLTVDFFIKGASGDITASLDEIRSLNSGRRDMITEIFSGVRTSFERGLPGDYKNIAAVISDTIPEGLAGLIANRLTDITDKPVVVIALPGKDGLVKGSGRCRSGLDFFSYVQPLASGFDRIGGHPQAFGFTIEYSKIAETIAALDLSLEGVRPVLKEKIADLELAPEMICDDTLDAVMLLEPFGNANEPPVFISRSVNAVEFSRFGSDRQHGRLAVKGTKARFVGWGMADTMQKYYGTSSPLDLVYTLEYNYFRNERSIQAVLADVMQSEL